MQWILTENVYFNVYYVLRAILNAESTIMNMMDVLPQLYNLMEVMSKNQFLQPKTKTMYCNTNKLLS